MLIFLIFDIKQCGFYCDSLIKQIGYLFVSDQITLSFQFNYMFMGEIKDK